MDAGAVKEEIGYQLFHKVQERGYSRKACALSSFLITAGSRNV